MITRRTLIAIGAAGACLVAAGSAKATFPGANGRIAFTHQSAAGHLSLATINPDGSDLRQLGPGGPSWSADGRRIVYSNRGDIYVMRADGSNKLQITFTPRSEFDPSFSPGGGRVVYWQQGTRFSGPARVMTMRSDGSDQHTLVREAIYPEWAPNGRHIAYEAQCSPSCMGPAIWTMRPDGSHRRQVYSGQGDGLYGGHYAPDSRSLVITQIGETAKSDTIIEVGAFGGNPHEVNSGPINFGAQISPDGRCLVGLVVPFPQGIPSNVYAKGSQCPTAGWLTNDRQPVYANSLGWQPLP